MNLLLRRLQSLRRDWQLSLFVVLLFFGFVFRLAGMLRGGLLWWDETVYIGMAQFIASGGAVGLWELFRPPLLPLLLSFAPLSGLNIVFWGHFIALFSSVGVLVLLFVLGQGWRRGVGLVAVALVVFAEVFFFFGSKVLSGTPATFLFLLAVFFARKDRWALAGLLASASFLMRFTQGVVIVGLFVAVFIDALFVKRQSFFDRRLWDKLFLLGGGFLVLFLPFLLLNIVFFSHPLAPIIGGSEIISEYNVLEYAFGNGYYVVGLLSQNVLFVLAPLGLWWFFKKKLYESSAASSLVLASGFLLGYFLWLVHKDIRFFIPLLPFFSLLAAAGLLWFVDLFSRLSFFSMHKRSVLAVVIVLSVFSSFLYLPVAFSSTQVYDLPVQQDAFLHFFDDREDVGVVLSFTPLLYQFSAMPIRYVPGLRSPDAVREALRADVSFVALDACDHPCETSSQCDAVEEILLVVEDDFDAVFDEEYVRWDDKLCRVVIWHRQMYR